MRRLYLHSMSVEELKKRISQLSSAEQNDVRQYIDMLQSNDVVLDPLPDQVWDEIERRETAYNNGELSSSPAHEVLSRLKQRQS